MSIANAIKALNITDWTLLGDPTNEAEFNAMFSVVVGVDQDGFSILSSDPAHFGITWQEIQNKIIELETEKLAAKEAAAAAKESALSKLSALGLTADEVKALLGVA
jgi:hypothetical protein